MTKYETYIEENHNIARALVGCEIESFYRLSIEDDEDEVAKCIGIDELIVVTNRGELLISIDEAMRNLIIFWIDPEDPKWGPHGRVRARIRAELDKVNAVERLVGNPIVSVAIVSRPGRFANHGSFCGLALSTPTSKAWIGSYLAETNDAGVSLLTEDDLAGGLIESGLSLDGLEGDSSPQGVASPEPGLSVRVEEP